MKNLIALVAVLALSACGFHPVYGVNKYTHTGVEEKLALVDIGNIPDREGQYLRNQLIDRFYSSGRPADPVYVLDISPVQESLVELDLTKTDDSTRGQLRLSTGIILKERATSKELLRREIRTTTSYNVLAREFATRVTEENARLNGLDDLARQIELQLNLYFKRTQ